VAIVTSIACPTVAGQARPTPSRRPCDGREGVGKSSDSASSARSSRRLAAPPRPPTTAPARGLPGRSANQRTATGRRSHRRSAHVCPWGVSAGGGRPAPVRAECEICDSRHEQLLIPMPCFNAEEHVLLLYGIGGTCHPACVTGQGCFQMAWRSGKARSSAGQAA